MPVQMLLGEDTCLYCSGCGRKILHALGTKLHVSVMHRIAVGMTWLSGLIRANRSSDIAATPTGTGEGTGTWAKTGTWAQGDAVMMLVAHRIMLRCCIDWWIGGGSPELPYFIIPADFSCTAVDIGMGIGIGMGGVTAVQAVADCMLCSRLLHNK